MFMVAGIYFLRDLLLSVFTGLLLRVRSSSALSLTICAAAAVLSAFLDALTVVAVIVTVGLGFYDVYHRAASGKRLEDEHDPSRDEGVPELHARSLEQFRAFLRGLMMHAAVGTAIGGVTTQVGEPQNLLIAKQAEWNFGQFFLEVAPVSLPVAVAGFTTCWLIDRFRLFGYGAELPSDVRAVLQAHHEERASRASPRDRQVLIVQAAVALILVLSLAFHVAEVGLIGLLVIVLATSFTGIIEENRIGKAFEAAMPFTALLVVFFVIVAQIHDQHLFEPVLQRGAVARGARAGGDALRRDRRAFRDQRQRVRRDDLHHRDQGGVSAGCHDPRAVRGAGRGDQHRHEHPERRDAERAGGVPVPAHVTARAADPARLPADGLDGAAVFPGHDERGSAAVVWLL